MLNLGLNMTYSSGVFLRGDESNQLKKTNPYMVFNADASWKLSKSFSFFARVDNLLDSKYETMGVLGEASPSTPIVSYLESKRLSTLAKKENDLLNFHDASALNTI